MMSSRAGSLDVTSADEGTRPDGVSRFAGVRAAVTDDQYDRAFRNLRELELSEMAALGVSAGSYDECWGWDEADVDPPQTVGAAKSKPMSMTLAAE